MKTLFHSCFAEDIEQFVQKNMTQVSCIILQNIRFTSSTGSARIAVYQLRKSRKAW